MDAVGTTRQRQRAQTNSAVPQETTLLSAWSQNSAAAQTASHQVYNFLSTSSYQSDDLSTLCDPHPTAEGPEGEGCLAACEKEKFGCCPDGVTAAHGQNGEGCCLNTEFKCCPDNITPAKGPDGEGKEIELLNMKYASVRYIMCISSLTVENIKYRMGYANLRQ